MSCQALFAEDRSTIDVDFEHTASCRNQCEVRDDVLVFAENVIRCAHGTARIVSTKAVGDAHFVALGPGLIHNTNLFLKVGEHRVALVEVCLNRLDLIRRSNERTDLCSLSCEPLGG